MKHVYVLTEENDNNNAVIGVYSTMQKAVNALFNYAVGMVVASSWMEPVGTRFNLQNGDTSAHFYIEEIEMDNTMFLLENKYDR